ncbi:hypothetical protein HID58_006103 [Brassica napus]|uniref:Uncharacterized protein n=1 Tax=Brassica napus TaxID=3708 RepID=A0ABQ8EAJ7_BRANA|nr:hypothetical protein HID58_006103 [Brassica napus]
MESTHLSGKEIVPANQDESVSIFVLTPMLLLHSSVSCGSRLFFFFLLCIFFSATLLCSLFSATLLCSLLGHFFLDPICL